MIIIAIIIFILFSCFHYSVKTCCSTMLRDFSLVALKIVARQALWLSLDTRKLDKVPHRVHSLTLNVNLSCDKLLSHSVGTQPKPVAAELWTSGIVSPQTVKHFGPPDCCGGTWGRSWLGNKNKRKALRVRDVTEILKEIKSQPLTGQTQRFWRFSVSDRSRLGK